MTSRFSTYYCFILFLCCQLSFSLTAQEINISKFPLDARINSEFKESHPFISLDGKTLFFTRKGHPQNIGLENEEDIWVSYRQEGDIWSKAVNVGAPLNNKVVNYVFSVNLSGDAVYINNPYFGKNGTGLAVTKKIGRTWTYPKDLEMPLFQNKHPEPHYYVNGTEKILLLAIESPTGLGQRDIYVSHKQSDNSWSAPKNLGAQINTDFDESAPVLAADTRTLYFATEGFGGLGQKDIWMSRRLDDSWSNWSTPENLGELINSTEEDIYFTIPASGKYMLKADANTGDIYEIAIPSHLQPQSVMIVTGKLIDNDTKMPLQGEVKIHRLSKSNTQQAAQVDEAGNYKFISPAGEAIGFYAEADGFFALSENNFKNFEELDFDNKLLNQNNNDNDNQSKEVEQLQLELNEVQQEVEDLETKRQQKKGYSPSSSPQQQNDFNRNPKIEAVKTKYEKLVLKKGSTAITNTTPQNDDSNTKKDTDLDKMKALFNNNYAAKKEGHSITPNTTKPPAQKENNELDKMKDRFNQHHGLTANETRTIDKTPITTTSSVEAPNFDLFKNTVQENLKKEMYHEVKGDLQNTVLTDVRKELEQDLTFSERQRLKNTVERQTKQHLKTALQSDKIQSQQNTTTLFSEEKLQKEIVEELRSALENEVRETLKRELKAEVRNEVRNEMMYWLKKEIEAEVRKELEEKLRKQIKAEIIASASPAPYQNTTENNNPLEPIFDDYNELEKDVLLLPIRENIVIPLNNLFFKANKTTLKEASNTELERLVIFMTKYKNLIIQIEAHTNGWCSHELADNLSKERAQAVADYLIEHGITSQRIHSKGYGKTRPIASNTTEEGRRKNQRIELRIVQILNK